MKSRVKKRVIALMLCMVMVLSSGISTLAEGDAGTPEATEEVSSTNDESAVNTEPDTAVAEESQSRSNTAVETETAAEENAPAEAEAQPKTAEAAPAENTEADAAAQTPVEETQTAETKDNAADAQSTEQSAENGEAVQEETTTPETENETAQNTETAPQPYEGKYEDDTIKITVNAEAGIVPEGAELSVTPIEKTEITDDMTAEEKAEAEKINDQYDLTEKKLNEDSKENEVTMEGFLAYDISFLVNGEEVEPNGDVNVVMEFQEAAVPEGVSEDAEVTVKHLKEDEKAEDGVVVEDMADKAEVQTTDKAEVEKVELTADSFSVFTLAWENAAAYAYGDVTISDNIMDEGVLQAEYSGTGSYKWLRSDDQNGNYEEVSKVYFEDGTSNISEDGSALYPALDKGARKWYKVQIIDGEKILAESQPIQVEYFDSLQNGSFETPVVPERCTYYENGREKKGPTNNMQYTNEEYREAGGVWQSTGESDSAWYGKKGVSLEIIHEGYTDNQGRSDGQSYSWYVRFREEDDWDNAAPEGAQFAELNCEAAGALYQDVLTMNDVPLNYSLKHRARGNDISQNSEYDTMYLVIMPTSIAVNRGLTTQQKLRNYLSTLIDKDENPINIDTYYDEKGYEELYDSDGVLVVRITSDDQEWQQVWKVAGYTPTSSLTRFFFVAGRTDADGESDNPTQGNFLDDVWFSQDLPEVHEGQFSLQINKKFEGLDNESFNSIKDKIQFKISATDSNGEVVSDEKLTELFGRTVINGSEMYPGADGSFSFPIMGQINPDESYTVKIEETNADLPGWTYTTNIKTSVRVSGGDSNESDEASFNLREETTATVTFTNSYEQTAKRDVNFKKVWDDENNKYNTRPDSLDVTLHASANSKDITSELGIDPITKTINKDTDWATVWQDLPVYYSDNGQKVEIEYTVTEGTINSNYEYSAGTLTEGTPSADETTTNSINAMSLMQSSANAGNTENSLGAPAHKKYIEYDEQNDEYTLNLDVTGAKGEAVGGADILFVIDTSNSMEDLLGSVQELLNGTWNEPGIIDQIFEAGSGNEVAFVDFNTKATRDRWYSSNDKNSAKKYISDLELPGLLDQILNNAGGTNWTDAMEEASALMQSKANDNKEKVVIFLSDGKPTYTNGSDGEPDGDGQNTEDKYYEDASKVVNESNSLKGTTFYSVYLTSNTKSGMEKFDTYLNDDNTKHFVKDGTDLDNALADIIKEVIPEYKDVTITDVLSEYVEFVESSPKVTVTQKKQDGSITNFPESDYQVSIDGKTVKVDLFDSKITTFSLLSFALLCIKAEASSIASVQFVPP
ncbi:MAG TPA: Cna B-type domain-containing protein, partial [Candidatus Mediterraneibacter vanvlietii]|nr:Cna B-type domain-containing protein [Candidatus Mediterraneibacter vanvlietii]